MDIIAVIVSPSFFFFGKDCITIYIQQISILHLLTKKKIKIRNFDYQYYLT